MNRNFERWRRMFKLWALPSLGILAMLSLAYWSGVARYFLFTHHLFWIISAFLLINPIAETVWPSAASKTKGRPKPQPSSHARKRRAAWRRLVRSGPSPESPMQRLSRLRNLKDNLERQIEKLAKEDDAIEGISQSRSKE